MIKIATIIAMLTVAIGATICKPTLFGANRFLASLVSFELLNILAIILTVTLASIANIHLSLNRIVRSAFKDKTKGAQRAEFVRTEINQNGWFLLALFVLACALLFLKGWSEDMTVLSLVHSMGLVILFANMIVLYDIQQVIYGLVRLEGRLPEQKSPEAATGNK